MAFEELPPTAAWRHRDAREGFESLFCSVSGTRLILEGHTAAVEDDEVWAVRYVVTIDEHWLTRTASVWARSRLGDSEVRLDGDGSGHWRVDGVHVPELDGCFDVDLESSACTNAIPVHRLRLAVGERADAPAVYVRALDLQVERLEQYYTRLEDSDGKQRYDYLSPVFDFQCVLEYDESGLILEYPGIATRVA